MPDLNIVASPTAVPHDAFESACDWGGTLVPAGHTVATAYVDIDQVVCLAGPASQLHPAEVERAPRRQLALAESAETTAGPREDLRLTVPAGPGSRPRHDAREG